MNHFFSKGVLVAFATIGIGVVSASAQTTAPNVGPAVNGALGTVGNTANGTLGTAGNTANGVLGTANGAVGTLGNATTGVVGGLQPTLAPVGQGVGNALNNLTQPDTVSALLQFLSSVLPNHIEAHVNLDALRVEKLTVDVRGVDLRNLRVDLLVANSRGAGGAQPMLGQNGSPANGNGGSMMNGSTLGASPSSGTNGNGGFSLGAGTGTGTGNATYAPLPPTPAPR